MVNKEIIYGRNSVLEALKSPRITAEKLYIPQTEVDPALAKIRRLAESMGIPCKSADKKKLDDMAKNGNHHLIQVMKTFLQFPKKRTKHHSFWVVSKYKTHTI